MSNPSWVDGPDVTYFTVRADERTTLNVAFSPLLLALERKTLAEPTSGGRYGLRVDEARAASTDAIELLTVEQGDDEAEFWKARKACFDRFRTASARNVVELVDPSGEIAGAAVRYAQEYTKALTKARGDRLRALLTIDTLHLTLDVGATESAVLVLPTHPLRMAWCVAHAALLHMWEERVLQQARASRSRLVDLALVSELMPTNMPAFVLHSESGNVFMFFRNLGFSWGVALPADAPDPLRRFRDIAHILGVVDEDVEPDSTSTRLAGHLREFQASHRYADPFHLALVNPDQGEFLSRSLEQLIKTDVVDDDADVVPVPALEIDAYVHDEHQTALSGLSELRTRQHEQHTRFPTDHLRPGIATSVRQFQELRSTALNAHVSIVSDLTRPTVTTCADGATANAAEAPSLYGLIARFRGSFQVGDMGPSWSYRLPVMTAGRADNHPAGPRFSDAIIEVQTAIQHAMGDLLRGQHQSETAPCLSVKVDAPQAELVARIHERSDWVVTLDRFFGVEYYDSPRAAVVGELAQRYLIDYSPGFVEGLGQRVVVTTAWRDEVTIRLRQAMRNLRLASTEQGVDRVLHALKTVSGRLALQVLSPDANRASVISSAVVTLWLQSQGRLRRAVLIPVDAHAAMFGHGTTQQSGASTRPGTLLLVDLKRNRVDATFVSFSWKSDTTVELEDLAHDIVEQVLQSAAYMDDRFFSTNRVDGVVQRAYLATVLRFYGDRAHRYGLMDAETPAAFLTNVAQLERPGVEFRPAYEGYIVSLDGEECTTVTERDVRVMVLTTKEVERASADLVAIPPVEDGVPAPDLQPYTVPRQSNGAAPDAMHSTDFLSTQDADQDDATAAATVPVPSAPSVVPAVVPENATNGQVPGNQVGTPPPVPPIIAATGDISVPLGQSQGTVISWKPSVQGSPHLFITGIPGQGKSWTTLHVLTVLAQQGVPAVVFDFHGQIGAAASPYVQVARPRVIDAIKGLPFSPFEWSADEPSLGWNATASVVADIFDYVCDLGPMQRDALFRCIRDAYQSRGVKAGDTAEPNQFPTLHDVLRRIEAAERHKEVKNLVARCRALLEMDIFQSSDSGMELFSDLIRHGLVVDLHRLASETLQLAAGAFLLRKIYRDMFSWGVADRLRLVVVLDEAHRLARDTTLPKIMKEGRKFGVAVVVASQGLADFHSDVVGNAGAKIAFRANYPDSRKIAGYFHAKAGYDLVASLEQLQVGQAIVQTPEMSVAARLQMRGPTTSPIS